VEKNMLDTRPDRPCAARSSRSAASAWLLAWLVLSGGKSSLALAEQVDEEAKRAQAREIGAAGLDDLEAGRSAEAAEKLDRAFALFAVPTLGLWSARARVQIGRWLEAELRYKETLALSSALGDNSAQDQAKKEAGDELAKLSLRIPSFVIELQNASTADTVVSMDGIELRADRINAPLRANPGRHTLVARRGAEQVVSAVELAEGLRRTVSFKLTQPVDRAAPEPSAGETEASAAFAREARPQPLTLSPSGLRWMGITGLAIGGVGLASAGVAAVVADHNLDDCPAINGPHSCGEQWQLDNYNAAKTVATVAFWCGVGGAVLGGAALLGLYASEPPESKPAVSWTIGPAAASVRASF
jgi:hypothetical protein